MEVKTISSGNDTVVFAATAADNGKDTITGFEAGNGKDVLDVSAFLKDTVVFMKDDASSSKTATGKNVFVASSGTAENVKSNVTFDANANVVVVIGNSGNSEIYYATAGSNGKITDLTSIVATVGSVTISDWDTANFA